jgi:hypothetical protein
VLSSSHIPQPPPPPPADWAAEPIAQSPPPPPPPPPPEFQAADPPHQYSLDVAPPPLHVKDDSAAGRPPHRQRHQPPLAAALSDGPVELSQPNAELLSAASPQGAIAATTTQTAAVTAGGGLPRQSEKHTPAAGCSSEGRQSSAELEAGGSGAAAPAGLEDGAGENCWIAAGQDVCPWEDE